jgi:hypothetical protein
MSRTVGDAQELIAKLEDICKRLPSEFNMNPIQLEKANILY